MWPDVSVGGSEVTKWLQSRDFYNTYIVLKSQILESPSNKPEIKTIHDLYSYVGFAVGDLLGVRDAGFAVGFLELGDLVGLELPDTVFTDVLEGDCDLGLPVGPLVETRFATRPSACNS